MKNKLFLSLLAVGTLFAACSKDKELAPSGEGEVVATFAIATPGAFTKVAGDGQSVDKVVCAVYDAAGTEITALRATETVTAKKATFSTRLVKGQAYRVAFFAYNDAAAAYDVTDLKNITVAGNQPANAEGRDAFTAFVDLSAADTEAPIAKDVHLYRPFAQLNIACSAEDWAAAVAAGITVASSSVSLSGQGIAFGAFNAYADEVVAGTEVASVDFAEAARLAEDLTVNGVAYKSIAMNYVLVGNKGEKNTADVTFAWKDANGKTDGATFTAVPLQRNWRTNIVGDLLTNSAVFNIIVDEPFDGDDNIEMPWNGTTSPVAAKGDVYEVRNGAELAWVAAQVNSGANTFEGKTVKLVEDIQLSDIPWTPIGFVLKGARNVEAFCGTFDGNGKTISGLNVSSVRSGQGSQFKHSAAGLFGVIAKEAVVKDVTVDGAKVNANHYAGVIAAYAKSTTLSTKVTISGCTVKNATIVSKAELMRGDWDTAAETEDWNNGDKVGAIVGYLECGDVTGNTVDNTTITAYRDLGGIVGYACGSTTATSTVSNNTITNVKITVDPSHNYKNYNTPSDYDANDIIGHLSNYVTVSGNTGTATISRPAANVPDGKVLSNGSQVESISAALTAAGNTDVALELGNGTYPMASNFNGNSLTIHGNGASVIDATNAWGGAGNEPKFQFRGKTVVFEDLTVNFSNDNSYSGIGVHATSVTYKNCKITGMQWAYDNIHFIDCEFENPVKCSVLVYGPNITFEGCSFKNGNSTWDEGGVKVYTEGGAASVELTGCKFHPYASENHIRGGVTINPQLLSTNRYTVTITDCESDYLINGNVWSFESTTGQDKVDLTVK